MGQTGDELRDKKCGKCEIFVFRQEMRAEISENGKIRLANSGINVERESTKSGKVRDKSK